MSHPSLNQFANDLNLSPDARKRLNRLVEDIVSSSLSDAQAESIGRSGTFVSTQATIATQVTPIALPAASPNHNRVAEPSPQASAYIDLGPIGSGGMGDVRRVRENALGRTLAMKIIKSELTKNSSAVSRFLEEAQICAQLEHPNIVPVHALGRLPDGRHFFTMQEVRGRPFTDVIRSVHKASNTAGRWDVAPHGWNLRALMGAFHKAAQAVGYAHARGVLHRDLKPDNIMVGDADGEVFVVDWGLSKATGRGAVVHNNDPTHPTIATRRLSEAWLATQSGSVTGTPAYMPPEQARGDVEALDQRADVYALGAILYQILTGRPPYTGKSVAEVLAKVIQGELPQPSEVVLSRRIPPELEAICLRAMAHTQALRYAHARDMAQALSDWLDGIKRRTQALEHVADARKAKDAATALQARANTSLTQGQEQLSNIPSWAPEEDKHPGWALEDEAQSLTRQAQLRVLEEARHLHAALLHSPDLAEAHAALAQHHKAHHQRVEALVGREDEALRSETLMRPHIEALPPHNPQRATLLRYLRGTGAFTLITQPSQAQAMLYRQVKRHRRLIAEPVRSLGRTPLREEPLEMGSYLLELQLEGHASVHYPFTIRRGQHWHGIPPGETHPHSIALPTLDELDVENDIYIPAGPFSAGGDPDAEHCFEAREMWVDAFVMQRFSVTNAEYIAFLNDLVSTGREEEALRHAPRERSGTPHEHGALIYHYEDGHFSLKPDADGDAWLPRYPVCMVNWLGAQAYAQWYARRTQVAWRLPAELEWEKAARGVDARFYPWGDELDPSWCCMRFSHPQRPLPSVVDAYPADVSVYGVRGLGGNMRNWCLDAYIDTLPESPRLQPRALEALPDNAPEPHMRVVRGGSWNFYARDCRSALRGDGAKTSRDYSIGLRLVRSWSE